VDASTNGYVAFGLTTGQIALEDYVMDTSSFSPGTLDMDIMRFVGGVDTANTILDFNFYGTADGTGPVASSFAVQLGSAGDFIWTVTLGTPLAIPTSGSMEVIFDDTRPENAAGGGRIFISQEPALAKGSSPGNPFGIPGSGPNGEPRDFAFELQTTSIPEPATAALIGLFGFGLILSRQRRRSH